MTEQEYRARPELNISFLKGYARSAAHAQIKKPETAAMHLGSAFHTRILEPEKFDERVIVLNVKKITYDHILKNPGKFVIGADDPEALNRMAEAVNANSEARDAISCGQIETPLFWELDGVACKGRPDVYAPDIDLIVDVKKVAGGDRAGASPKVFLRQLENLLYNWQGAFYLDGHKAKTGRDGRFCFVCVEDTPPHGVACYNLHPRHVELGRQGYRKAIQMHLECVRTGRFPAYPEGWIELAPSKWAGDGFTNYEMEDDFNGD